MAFSADARWRRRGQTPRPPEDAPVAAAAARRRTRPGDQQQRRRTGPPPPTKTTTTTTTKTTAQSGEADGGDGRRRKAEAAERARPCGRRIGGQLKVAAARRGRLDPMAGGAPSTDQWAATGGAASGARPPIRAARPRPRPLWHQAVWANRGLAGRLRFGRRPATDPPQVAAAGGLPARRQALGRRTTPSQRQLRRVSLAASTASVIETR